ncbi:gp10 [Mycobacterium phage Corndog]|uniref:Uncharacterized protein n=2 Tax=Mycobacterium phage Corndog TaxID=205875 RepID=Q856T4_BPMCO|nr:gp10 [Mycobacterium phage Corndog]AAN01942.1 hypothetical protein PBI_CORNDOG_10 [Mycobacterium phage Corndog]AII28249.1 hypothetical protein PBI_YUNGJAMAL_10 [Mycobacterium phage YungJamal]
MRFQNLDFTEPKPAPMVRPDPDPAPAFPPRKPDGTIDMAALTEDGWVTFGAMSDDGLTQDVTLKIPVIENMSITVQVDTLPPGDEAP